MLGGVGDAEARRRHGLEPGRPDRLLAHLAIAVAPGLESRDGRLDLVESLPQLGRQTLGLAPLGGHLARVGEVRVVVEAAPLVSEAQLFQLGLQSGLFVAQKGSEIDVGGLRRGGLVRHGVMLRGPSPPFVPARGWAPS